MSGGASAWALPAGNFAIAPGVMAVPGALNSSAMYLGQGIGAGLGGAPLTVSGYRWLSWVGAALLAAAMLLHSAPLEQRAMGTAGA